MGDQGLARIVIEGFMADAPGQLTAVQAYLVAGDAPSVQLQAHTLKGSSATVGAEALRAASLALELTAAELRLDLCAGLLADVTKEFARFKSATQEAGWIRTKDADEQTKETSDVQA
jgi:HPt (histidine-containing phosphotransfer) domain-containing protein